jgi:hypothetical protein
MNPTAAPTMRQALNIMLSGYHARIEMVSPGVAHIHTTRGQLENIRETVKAHLVGVDNVLAYDDYTLGVFMTGAA